MRVPLSWLREYVEIVDPPDVLAHRLTMAGLEVTAVDYIGVPAPGAPPRPDPKGKPTSRHYPWDPETIVVGELVRVDDHPKADRLVLASVNYGGDEPITVVTGAPNLFPYKGKENLGLKVAFAQVGAVLLDGYSEELKLTTLKPGKLRGVRSEGMVLSEKELGLSDDHEGIIILPDGAPVGVPLAEYLGDVVLNLDLTPNLARCLSMIGVAREVAALTGGKLRLPDTEMQATGPAADSLAAVEIEDPDLCARYCATIIQGINVRPSPSWMQQRLLKAGMRPINVIVDVTNYVMLEWGQPLHAFDYDRLVARAQASGAARPTIIVRRARPGERLRTLDGVERELDPDMLMIADTAGTIAVAGVMGGEETEVTAETANVLLESASFEYINNRRTSQALKLPSEASHRFSRGAPAELASRAVKRASEFMRTLAGGVVAQGVVDTYPVPQPTVVVDLTEREVQRQLGAPVSQRQITDVLKRLDFGVDELPGGASTAGANRFGMAVVGDEPVLRCRVPWHRLDITHPADLIEEVARVIGYEQIPTTLMADSLPPQRRNYVLETEERIRDILVAAGLQEVITYSLTTVENHDKVNPGRPQAEEANIPFVRLANPLTSERTVMRRFMMVTMLENLAYNSRYARGQAVFEVGRVYWPEEGDGLLPYEDRRLCIALAGPRDPEHWLTEGDENYDFFDLKGVLEALFEHLGLDEEGVVWQAHQSPTFGPRCAHINYQGQSLGIMGELHPAVRANFDLPYPRVVLAELHSEPLVQREVGVKRMEPISVYPAVKEDIALVVEESVQAVEVLQTIRHGGGPLLRDVTLFDVYRGPAIAAGKKSLAFALTFQADDRVLTDAEVARVRVRIVRQTEESLGAVLRK